MNKPDGAGTAPIAVIGAGIVGMSCAAFLQRDGRDVIVVDRVAPGKSTSFGNAGGIAIPSIVPHALPGVWKKVPGWLADPLGPLTIRWHYLLQIAPWLLRMLREASPERVREVVDATWALNEPARRDIGTLMEWAGKRDLIVDQGCLTLYHKRQTFEAEKDTWAMRDRLGIPYEVLDASQIRQMEPALAPVFEVAVHKPTWSHVKDPYEVVKALADRFLAGGGRILEAEVRDVEMGPDGPVALVTESERLPISGAVVAAGAWSHRLTTRFGHPVPLETERGYHITLPKVDHGIRRALMHGEGKFAVTPMSCGLRLAGTVELAGLEAPPDPRRVDALLVQCRRFIPGLNEAAAEEGATTWMGHRPCLPDSLPVIGAAPGVANLWYAFGHSHLGLTQAPPTGRMIADLVAGRRPDIDPRPYRADRF